MILLKFRRTKEQYQMQKRKHALGQTKTCIIENDKIQSQTIITVTLTLHSNHLQSSPLILSKFEWFMNFYLFLSGGFFTNIQDSKDSRGRGRLSFLILLYHFGPLHRHLDISRAITAESSPLHIASSRNWTGNLWFPSASC